MGALWSFPVTTKNNATILYGHCTHEKINRMKMSLIIQTNLLNIFCPNLYMSEAVECKSWVEFLKNISDGNKTSE